MKACVFLSLLLLGCAAPGTSEFAKQVDYNNAHFKENLAAVDHSKRPKSIQDKIDDLQFQNQMNQMDLSINEIEQSTFQSTHPWYF